MLTQHLSIKESFIDITLNGEGGTSISTQDAGTLVSASDLVTVSDYFSFVGADVQGHVAFAIDNNRGRDGSTYQAEHFYAVLHDEHQGWMPVSGVGRHENTNHALLMIPDSTFFQFVGHPATGLTITSQVNQLALRLDAIPERLVLADDETIFALGSAAALLTWKERMIPGRVIYEYLVKKNFNLMTRRSFKGLRAFQELYPAFRHGFRPLRPAFPYEADGSRDPSSTWLLGAWRSVRAA